MTVLDVCRMDNMYQDTFKGHGQSLDSLLGYVNPTSSVTSDASESDFFMFCFKIQPCPMKHTHPWEECCYAHPHENARRRDPRKYQYIAEPCPDYKRGICLLGSACPYAHGVYERNLHPSKYRTQMCTETGHCSRKVCFFAHETWQLRAPTHVWTVEAAEYMRQVRLEEIIRDTQQVALREKAMEMLASSRHLAARGGPAAYFGPGPPAAPGMNPFQQQHLQHQLLQGLAEGNAVKQAATVPFGPLPTINSPFAQHQVGSPPSTLQLPATPPAAVPYPPRNTSTSPVRMHDGGRALSPDGRRGINLRQALSQPTPATNDTIGDAALSNILQTAAQVNVRRQQRALTEDTEGPRMSMAMRRQLGMAPNKSPSKAVAAALAAAGSGQLRSRGSPGMSPAQSGTLPLHASGVLGGQAIDPVSQGLLLQQAALALQMAHLNSPQAAASHDQEAASAVALHAALRAQQGASVGSEVSVNSTDDYSNLVSQLQGLCFGYIGDGGLPTDGTQQQHSQQMQQQHGDMGSPGREQRSGSGSSAPSFELDLSGTGQLGTTSQAPATTCSMPASYAQDSFFSY